MQSHKRHDENEGSGSAPEIRDDQIDAVLRFLPRFEAPGFEFGGLVSRQGQMPYFSFSFTKLDSFLGGGQTYFSPRATFSTSGFLGASKLDHATSSRPGTGGFFAKYEHSIMRFQKFIYESYMIIRSQFQLASRTLPPSPPPMTSTRRVSGRTKRGTCAIISW